MKTCTYCGRENPDVATHCAECGTDEFKLPAAAGPPAAEAPKDWVTLQTCQTLIEADLLASQLEGAGIKVFIPDQFLMQTCSLGANAFGFARVQVAPEDLEEAKEILATPAAGAPPLLPPPLTGIGVG